MKAVVLAFLSIVMLSCGSTSPSTMFSDHSADPTGQKARYKVDNARTMRAVQSGTFDLLVMGKSDIDNTYNVKIDYALKIVLLGVKTGSQMEAITQNYWSDLWWEELRKTGHQEATGFKVDHLGYENTTTMNGQQYNACDKIKVYDIDTTGTDAKDVVMIAYISRDRIPALGAAKFDTTGVMSGTKFFLGADYTEPKWQE